MTVDIIENFKLFNNAIIVDGSFNWAKFLKVNFNPSVSIPSVSKNINMNINTAGASANTYSHIK